MPLLDLWNDKREEISSKSVEQIIGFAGDGKLRDNSQTSREFRDFLRHIPTDILVGYGEQCLTNKFTDSGLVLQDIVNEIGQRLDFKVTHGRYHGVPNEPGYDGLWADGDHHTTVVEVKTTDAYSIKLDNIANYRKTLTQSNGLDMEKSSMLVVVGREDTGVLEAQIRGSRYAWDMRVISFEALSRMLKLKEEIDDPSTIECIHNILIPCEFTKLDPIIDIAFTAVADVRQDEAAVGGKDEEVKGKKFTPVNFHEECIAPIEKHLGISLMKRSRARFSDSDGDITVTCIISRSYKGIYWFIFHLYQAEYLEKAKEKAFLAFGCGDEKTIFLIPYREFKSWLKNFTATKSADKWYVYIRDEGNQTYKIIGREGKEIDITEYKIG